MMNRLKFLPICFTVFSLLLMGSLTVLGHAANAGAACNAPNNNVNGADVEECTLASDCMVCTMCCSTQSVMQMSQDAFNNYRKDFIMDAFYTCPVEPDFQKTTDEIRDPLLLRIAAIGAFLDASILNDTLKDLGVLSAKALQTYTPSQQICQFGTLSRSLSASEAKMNSDKLQLSELGLAKNLGTANTVSAAGRGLENETRLRLFVDKFCDLQDNNFGMSGICKVAAPTIDLDHNRDVDYARLLGKDVTINADLTDSDLTQDENSLVALSHLLYGHRIPTKRISYTDLSEKAGFPELYAEYRTVSARRAAAQNTYNTLAAMKMAGSGGSDQYMRRFMEKIGVSGANADRYLGAQNSAWPFVNTSYNGQMNVLTKHIYQDPSFYVNLMDSKANTKRTSAALQAIGLMQGRDTYQSVARSEMLMGILVDLEARRIANSVRVAK